MSRAAWTFVLFLVAMAVGAGFAIGAKSGTGFPGIPGFGSGSGSSAIDSRCREGGNLMATINESRISTADIDTELAVQKALQSTQGLVMPQDEATLRSFRRELLDQVVDQVAIGEAAKEAGYLVSPADVAAELPGLLQRYNITEPVLRQSVEADGVTPADFDRWAMRQVGNGRYLEQLEQASPYSSPEDQAARAQEQMLISFCVGGETVAPAQVGRVAPDFELERPEGGTIRLSELRGKAVMVNFWATWCGPCKIEMPLYLNAYEKNKDDLVVLAVDVEEDAPIVTQYVQANRLTFPIALDRDGEVSLIYRVRGLPTTYFVDRDGMVVEKHRGAILNRPQLQPYLEKILPGAAQGRLHLELGRLLGLLEPGFERSSGPSRVVDAPSDAG